MKRFAILSTLFMFWTSPALAQDKPISILLSKQEQVVILELCQAALWAARIRFDGVCEQLQKKFADAEKPKEETTQSK